MIVLMAFFIILSVSIAGCGAPSTKTSTYAPSTTSNNAPSSVKELTFTTQANPEFIFSDIKMSDDVNFNIPKNTYLTGKIQNVGSTVSGKVEITAYFYDKDGLRLGDTGTGIINLNFISNLKPGETAVFRISVDNKNLTKNTVKVDLTAKGYSSPSFKKTNPEFVFSDMKMMTKSEYGTTYFTGKIQNVGSTVHERVVTTAYLCDKDGLRLGDASTSISNLRPGETAVFEMYIWYKDNVANIVKWEVTAEDY
jgi:hypothetical protein